MGFEQQARLPINIAWKTAFVANLILGISYWFGLSTDYKLKDSWADIGFTYLVGIVGWGSWISVVGSGISRSCKVLFAYIVAPSIVGSTPYMFLSVVGIWLLSIAGTAPLVDEIESPDHSKLIKVYYVRDFLSEYCLHSYQVSLQYRSISILRRDITSLQYIPNNNPPRCIEYGERNPSVDTEIEWLDNNKISVPDREQGIKIIDMGLVKFDWPISHMRFLMGYVGLLIMIHGIQRFRDKQQNEYT